MIPPTPIHRSAVLGLSIAACGAKEISFFPGFLLHPIIRWLFLLKYICQEEAIGARFPSFELLCERRILASLRFREG